MVSSAIGEAKEAEENGIVIWARGNAQDHQRADALITAIKQDPELYVAARAEMYHIGAGSYASLWDAAYQENRPPDIVALDIGDLPDWVAKGRIQPFDNCLNQYPQFEAVRPELWTSVTWQGQRWGVPHELGLSLFYFSKSKLRQLGWSEARIEGLPQAIQSGRFSLQEMQNTAREAIDSGVVNPGFGFWNGLRKGTILNQYAAFNGRITDPAQPDKLIISRSALEQTYAFAQQLRQENITPANIASAPWNQSMGNSVWHDVVSHGQVLFWYAPIWYWVRWAEYYTGNAGGYDYLEDRVGYALLPSGQPGQPGFTWMITRFYALSTNRTDEEAARACRVLARATVPENNLKHVTDNYYLSVLQPASFTHSQGQDSYGQADILHFGESASAYGRMLPVHNQYGRYQEVLWDYSIRAESSDLSPREAANDAIERLQADLGDALIVEP